MTIVPVTSERLGFRNILCPSSHQVGQGSLGGRGLNEWGR